MQIQVKTPHTKIDMTGDIPETIITMLKEIYGKKVTLSDEYVDVKDTDWYKNIKSKITPGETISFYRKMHKMTQKEPGEKLGNFSKQNVSEMERNICPI